MNEIWEFINPKKGDHIRVSRGFYYHHGVYISNNEIIHFTGENEDAILDMEKNKVIATDLGRFLMNGRLETKIYTEEELNDLYPIKHIVKYARACLGDMGYNLIFNNCEHFANVCTLGRFRSIQVEKFFNIILGGGEKMGFLSFLGGAITKLGNFISGNSGSSSSGGGSSSSSRHLSNNETVYRPDDVRIAEINKEKEIELGKIGIDRINAEKEARLELMKAQEEMQMAIEEARAQGMKLTVEAIILLQKHLQEIASESFKVIEGASLEVVKEVENLYYEIGNKLKEDDNEYYTKKLPVLWEQLEKFEKDTPTHNMFLNKIDMDITTHIKRQDEMLLGLKERRNKLIDSHIKSKDKMIENTAKITEKLVEKYSLESDILAEKKGISKNKIEKIENKESKLIESNE